MPEDKNVGMIEKKEGAVLVAGDVCLDVLGVPMPGAAENDGSIDNWRLTGEVRMHYLAGGAFLLADLIRGFCNEWNVNGPIPCRPGALSCNAQPDQAMSIEEMLNCADRLTREEIIHSLMQINAFKENPGAKMADTLRVSEAQGFSGPEEGDPRMTILPPEAGDGIPCAIVLDDTGNLFRRSPGQWPAAIKDGGLDKDALIAYWLRRPLPGRETQNPLWDKVMENDHSKTVVIVSVDDLRQLDAPISQGLSWERTALDIAWNLLHEDTFKPLRDCRHLIVCLGMDGALYWRRSGDMKKPHYHAWIIYDPVGIEGTGADAVPGVMVGQGCAFVAALVGQLVNAGPMSVEEGGTSAAIKNGIKAGLSASRNLLRFGFGKDRKKPAYPTAQLLKSDDNQSFFACQPVPLIQGAAVPDRGYWRLLESIFRGNDELLHRAVVLTATEAKPINDKDKQAAELLRQAPVATFAKALKAIDRHEIENYRALYSLLQDYVAMPSAPRPLSLAVFGPPGAGKSFGVKMVAKALGELGEAREIKVLTFNLSQYQRAEDLADAFHLVRDCVLKGKIPLVFFDEFDTSLEGNALGWLRYFLAPMQDGEFLDSGTPHSIGQAIFIFAGGTCESYLEFAEPFLCASEEDEQKEKQETIKRTKGRDFLSRLRGTLDIPGLNLQVKCDPFGPVEGFPCEPAILLRRASILAYQLGEKAPHMRDASGALQVSGPVLRALLYLPSFVHGNRSFEAILDMSHLSGSNKLTPALLPASVHTDLHADAMHLGQLLAVHYPFAPEEREMMARMIHKLYREQRRKETPPPASDDPAIVEWEELRPDLQRSNLEQADHIAVKLRAAGLWIRKVLTEIPVDPKAKSLLDDMLETLARSEHDRWVIEKRKQGWIPAADTFRDSRNNDYLLHNALFLWEELPEEMKELDRGPVRNIPKVLEAAGYEIIETH